MVKEMIAEFKKNIGRFIIPIGVGFGLPSLYKKNNRFLLLIPLLEKLKHNKDGSISLKKPVGEIRFDLDSKKMILFKLYYFNDPIQGYDWKTEYAKFPPLIAIMQSWSHKKYYEERDNYYTIIDEIYSNWKNKKYNADKITLLKLKFDELVEDGMEKYYTSVNFK